MDLENRILVGGVMGGQGSGRRRTPTALRALDGGKAAKRAAGEVKPTAVRVTRPAKMSPRGRVIWDRFAPDLVQKGLLTSWDAPLFETWCEAYVTFEDARKALRTQGVLVPGRAGSLVANPAQRIMRQAAAEMKSIGARFGMSPSDRAGLESEVTPGRPEGVAEFR